MQRPANSLRLMARRGAIAQSPCSPRGFSTTRVKLASAANSSNQHGASSPYEPSKPEQTTQVPSKAAKSENEIRITGKPKEEKEKMVGNMENMENVKTMAEQDEEVKARLEGRSGEGGASGLEYENGKAPGLKRGVRDNMFRVI